MLGLLDVISVELSADRSDVRRLDEKVTGVAANVTGLEVKVDRLELKVDRFDVRAHCVETRVESVEIHLRSLRREFERRIAPLEP